MNVLVSVNKIPVDIIEVFDDYLVVQEIKSKQIYIVKYWDIDSLQCEPIGDKMTESNVISIAWARNNKYGKE